MLMHLLTRLCWPHNHIPLQVLKRRRADGSPLIQVDQLRDGVVLFEDVADAERYSNYMEAESNAQVSVVVCMCNALNNYRTCRLSCVAVMVGYMLLVCSFASCCRWCPCILHLCLIMSKAACNAKVDLDAYAAGAHSAV